MKNLLLFIMALLFFCGCGDKNAFTVKGTVEGFEDGIIFILDPEDNRIAESTITNGNFAIKGTVDKIGDYKLRSEKRWIAGLFLEPGSNLTLTGKVSDGPGDPNVTISGNVPHDNMIAYYKEVNALYERYDKSNREQGEKLVKERSKISDRYYKENLDNMFGVSLLKYQTHFRSATEIMAMIEMLPESIQQTSTVQSIRKGIEKQLITEPGQKYMDINLPDKDGNYISVSSLLKDNKYIFIDFWASWCGSCLQEVPYLKVAYDRYHDKGFEIYGISLDSDRDKWLKSAKDNEMNWVHVCSFDAWKDEFAKKYLVSKVPANFLIDANGTIIGKNLRGKEVEEILSQYIK